MTNDFKPCIFVTGATGQLGSLVIKELLKHVPASSIVAGARSPDGEAAMQLKAQGVEVRHLDYSLPDTLVPAFTGIDRLLLISSEAGPERLGQHQNVINAAKEAKVGLIAYTSLLHADTAMSALGEDHRNTEAALQASGLPFTILRHGWYIENHVFSVPPAIQHGAVIGSAGEGRFSSAAREDFAAADAAALMLEDPAGRIFELAGDESYSLSDLANTISVAAGKPVVYQDMPKEKFKQVLIGMGMPDPVAEIVSESDASASKGELEDHGRQLSALIGRPAISYRQIIEKAISTT